MIVELSPSEVLVCECIGRMRSLIARTANVKDVKIGQHDGSNADVMGFKGEYAFAKYFNVFPDLGLSPRSGSYDGVLKNYKYDIKSTHIKNGRLLATKKVNPDVDIYVLCIVEDNHVDIKGYVEKKDFIMPQNLKSLGHGEGYCLNQSQLKQFKSNEK
ncbi:hypothetical protein [uncultured Mediterranean phage uvMED]|jgi:hypothetical protein|nr:hypothetical protein [uncultured Mediterranean phage uvMED]